MTARHAYLSGNVQQFPLKLTHTGLVEMYNMFNKVATRDINYRILINIPQKVEQDSPKILR